MSHGQGVEASLGIEIDTVARVHGEGCDDAEPCATAGWLSYAYGEPWEPFDAAGARATPVTVKSGDR